MPHNTPLVPPGGAEVPTLGAEVPPYEGLNIVNVQVRGYMKATERPNGTARVNSAEELRKVKVQTSMPDVFSSAASLMTTEQYLMVMRLSPTIYMVHAHTTKAAGIHRRYQRLARTRV